MRDHVRSRDGTADELGLRMHVSIKGTIFGALGDGCSLIRGVLGSVYTIQIQRVQCDAFESCILPETLHVIPNAALRWWWWLGWLPGRAR